MHTQTTMEMKSRRIPAGLELAKVPHALTETNSTMMMVLVMILHCGRQPYPLGTTTSLVLVVRATKGPHCACFREPPRASGERQLREAC